MKTSFSGKMLMLLVVCFACVAEAKPNGAVSLAIGVDPMARRADDGRSGAAVPRAFEAYLHRKDDGAADQVFFRASTRTLTICQGGREEQCASYMLERAVDVVPADSESVGKSVDALLVVRDDGTVDVCKASRVGGVECWRDDPDQVAARSRLSSNGKMVVANVRHRGSQSACTYVRGYPGKCASARSGSSVRAGEFSVVGSLTEPSAVQLLSRRHGVTRVCRLHADRSVCESATGLEPLEALGADQVFALWSASRSVADVVGVGKNALVVCRAEAKQRSRFHCVTRSLAVRLHAVRLQAVTGLERGSGRAAAETLAVLGAMPHSMSQATVGHVSVVAGQQRAVSEALRAARKQLAAVSGSWRVGPSVERASGDVRTGGFAGSRGGLGFDDDEDSEELWWPEFVEFMDDVGNRVGFWSDSFNVLVAYATASQLSREQCLQGCDLSRDADAGLCAILAAALIAGGYLSTAAIAIGSIASGPAVFGILATGVSISTDVAAGVAAVCAARVWYEWMRCLSSC